MPRASPVPARAYRCPSGCATTVPLPLRARPAQRLRCAATHSGPTPAPREWCPRTEANPRGGGGAPRRRAPQAPIILGRLRGGAPRTRLAPAPPRPGAQRARPRRTRTRRRRSTRPSCAGSTARATGLGSPGRRRCSWCSRGFGRCQSRAGRRRHDGARHSWSGTPGKECRAPGTLQMPRPLSYHDPHRTFARKRTRRTGRRVGRRALGGGLYLQGERFLSAYPHHDTPRPPVLPPDSLRQPPLFLLL